MQDIDLALKEEPKPKPNASEAGFDPKVQEILSGLRQVAASSQKNIKRHRKAMDKFVEDLAEIEKRQNEEETAGRRKAAKNLEKKIAHKKALIEDHTNKVTTYNLRIARIKATGHLGENVAVEAKEGQTDMNESAVSDSPFADTLDTDVGAASPTDSN